MRKTFKIFLYVLLVLTVVFLCFLLSRVFSSRQIDDVSPQIRCDEELLEKSDILFIIPKYNNISISENKSWCEYILSLNKTLAMHGVYHNYNEFYTDRGQEYLDEGKEEFYKCFGFYPEHFKAPQLAVTNTNKELIKSQMKFYGYPNQILHKVYHCSDRGKFTNRLIDWI